MARGAGLLLGAVSGSAVDYRKRPPSGARQQGAAEHVADEPPVTWSGVLHAVEANLSTAESELERVADGYSERPAEAVASDAAHVVHTVQVMGTLLRMLHERLERVESAGGSALQSSPRITGEAAHLMDNWLRATA